MGARVHSTVDEVEILTHLSAFDVATYDDMGEITDLVMDREGRVRAVIVGVGGFLGMGEHHVAIDIGTVRLVPDRVFLVVNTGQQALKAMPAYRSSASQTAEPACAGAMITIVGGGRPMLHHPLMGREDYSIARLADVTTPDLVSARDYDTSDTDIGKVEEPILGDDATQVQTVVLDTGDILGLARQSVALAETEVLVLPIGHAGDVRDHVDAAKAELEALPRYDN